MSIDNTSDSTAPSKKSLLIQLSKLTFSAILFGVVTTALLLNFTWLGAVACIASAYTIWLSFGQAYKSNTPR